MNQRTRTIIKDFFYSTASNLMGAVISALLVLIVPKFIPVDQYGYWQMAVFYFSYIGFFHFGWADGAYLRYGGAIYGELDKGLFKNQFFALVAFEFLLGIGIFGSALLLPLSGAKKYIFGAFAIGCVLQLPGSFLRLMLQATGRIKEYSQNILVDKGSYGVLICLLLILGVRSYRLLILADILTRFASTAHAAYLCRDILLSKETCTPQTTFLEARENIKAGSKLLFANLTSMLIIGIVRFGIEHSWDVSTFGKVSLTLSISNFAMIFVSAVSMIAFPLLKRTKQENWAKIYHTMNTTMMIPIVGILLFFFPLRWILMKWLPAYYDSLKFMAILFPMCLYEGKNTLLINTYLKALRKEKVLLYSNVASVIISLGLTLTFTVFTKNLEMAVLSIVVVLAFRCSASEIVLSRYLKVNVMKSIVLEFLCSCVFIYSASMIESGLVGFGLYLVVYLIYVGLNFKELKESVGMIKNISH